MDNNVVLSVEKLSKKFCKSLKRSMVYGSADVLRGMFGIGSDPGKLRKSEYWALEDINFEVKKGETFGIIGANGSGKSTLLRLINGIFPPDKGKISVSGRIGALIAVGAGFHPHMTGRENIYLNGTILGMTNKEIKLNMEKIIDFAEIGDFLDAPVNTYSSGMYVRLGFAIAIHSKPDIVLVDEILAVGDAKFQRKCLDKIKEMRALGTTFFLVSHNMQNIESMCNRVLLLDHGKPLSIGSPRDVIPQYEHLLQGQISPDVKLKKIKMESGELSLISKYNDFGTDEVVLNGIKVLNGLGGTNDNIYADKPMCVITKLESKREISDAVVYMTFTLVVDKNNDEINLCTLAFRKSVSIKGGKSIMEFYFETAQLTTGEYKIGFSIFDDTFTNPYLQGYYGYFKSNSPIPTMLRVGGGTPYCWANPTIRQTK